MTEESSLSPNAASDASPVAPVVQPATVQPAIASTPPLDVWKTFAISAAVAVAVSWLSIVVYDRFLKAPPRLVATIGLQDVLEAKQAQFAEIVSRPGATDADRNRALDAVEQIAPQLSKAITELSHDCNCLVLVKEAVVGNSDLDLTPQLMQRMGTSPAALDAVRSRLRTPQPPTGVVPPVFPGASK